MRRAAIVALACSLSALAASGSHAQAATVSPSLYQGMHWRFVGPLRGGRTVAIDGIANQPNVFYIAAVDGGIWKTQDAGRTWVPIFDSEGTGSIGALAVAPSNPNVVYAGSGEGLQRPDLSVGDGIYKSTDAGATWTHLGLRDGAADRVHGRGSDEPGPPLRRGARPSVRSQPRARHLPFDRRRCDVRARPLHERRRGRLCRYDRPARSEDRLCDPLGRAASPLGDRRIVRDRGQRRLQIERRRNDLDAVDVRPSRADRTHGSRRRAEQLAGRLRVRRRRGEGRRQRARSIAATTPARTLQK